MRRIALAAFLVAMALIAPYLALANNEAMPGRERVLWRTSAGNTAGYLDSSIVRENGSANATRDTTAWLSMDGFVPYTANTSTEADSTLFMRFAVIPTGSTTLAEGADSLYVYYQVAEDPNGPIDVTGGQELIALENGTGNTFYWNIKQSSAVVGIPLQPISGTAPSNVQMFGFPWVRFIIRGDINGEYEGYVTRYKVPTDNYRP